MIEVNSPQHVSAEGQNVPTIVPESDSTRRVVLLEQIEQEKTLHVEKVNHPKHYNNHPSGVECIDIIEHMTFNLGTAMKYLWRSGLKDGEPVLQELEKALWYINREIAKVKGQAK